MFSKILFLNILSFVFILCGYLSNNQVNTREKLRKNTLKPSAFFQLWLPGISGLLCPSDLEFFLSYFHKFVRYGQALIIQKIFKIIRLFAYSDYYSNYSDYSNRLKPSKQRILYIF